MRPRTVLIVLAVVVCAVVVSGVGFVGACKYTSLRCNVLIYGDPLEQTSGDTTLPDGFSSEVVASGFDVPTAFDFLPDGRILVAEKDGLVRVIEDGRVMAVPLLDLTGKVNSVLYRGLVDIAVDPEFETNGSIYVVYSTRRDEDDSEAPAHVVVSRFVVDGSTATDEQVILGADGAKRDDCADLPAAADCLPSDVDHIGADIAFGADSSMFVATGDGGGHERVEDNAFGAQDVDALGGKILRVTTDGLGLPTNPFFDGDARSNRSKVWATGLRNPFRMTLAPGEGIPVVGDVGWTTADEVSFADAGVNLGWPCYEGRTRTPKYEATSQCAALYASDTEITEPAIEIPHTGVNSLTGGVFYTGTAYPSEYQGYFYGDWAQSWIRRATIDVADGVLEGEPAVFAEGAGGPVDFRVGGDGHLYYLALNFRELRRIVYTG